MLCKFWAANPRRKGQSSRSQESRIVSLLSTVGLDVWTSILETSVLGGTLGGSSTFSRFGTRCPALEISAYGRCRSGRWPRFWTAWPRRSLGCVDILVMMLVCQMLSCQQNNGTGFSISCVAAPACMSLRKKIASDLSRPFCGLTAPAPNGGCFRPNTGIGTVSINDSPVGLTKASGSRCFNISPATRTWNT